MSLTLRYMQFGDIRQVATIDVMCFDPPWSSDSYAFEISESKVSHMVVLEEIAGDAPQELARRDSILARLLGRGWAESAALGAAGRILGYGGLWKIKGEAHISTIAMDPAWRGKGYGEILLAGMFGKALRLRADFIVLEVRVSNAIAQSLYRKYGFSAGAAAEEFIIRATTKTPGICGSRWTAMRSIASGGCIHEAARSMSFLDYLPLEGAPAVVCRHSECAIFLNGGPSN